MWARWGVGLLVMRAPAASFVGQHFIRSRRSEGHPGPAGPATVTALAGGMLGGGAADFMLTYLLLGLALAWGLRRAAAALTAALAGIGALVGPAHLRAGRPLIRSLLARRGQ